MKTFGFALTLVVGGLMSLGPAGAYSLRSRSKRSLEREYARSLSTIPAQVQELKAYDLSRAGGVVGFTLGRHRSKDGRRSHSGAVIYFRCGEKLCLAAVRLLTAEKIRSLQLLDLAARATTLRLQGPWVGGTVTEPSHTARWPVLVVEAEHTKDQHRSKQLSLISLRTPRKPYSLVSFTTLDTRVGAAPDRRRGRHPRFNGRRVTSARVTAEPGRPPQLIVMEKRISTRFNRCRAPEPEPTIYELENKRFVLKSEPRGLGGCL